MSIIDEFYLGEHAHEGAKGHGDEGHALGSLPVEALEEDGQEEGHRQQRHHH